MIIKKTFLYKGVALVLAALSMTMLFTSCGKTQIEKAQDKVVSIGKQFLDYKLTADEACEQLESIVIPEANDNGSIFFKADVGYLKLLIVQAKSGASNFQKIEETLQDIKEQEYESR